LNSTTALVDDDEGTMSTALNLRRLIGV